MLNRGRPAQPVNAGQLVDEAETTQLPKGDSCPYRSVARKIEFHQTRNNIALDVAQIPIVHVHHHTSSGIEGICVREQIIIGCRSCCFLWEQPGCPPSEYPVFAVVSVRQIFLSKSHSPRKSQKGFVAEGCHFATTATSEPIVLSV